MPENGPLKMMNEIHSMNRRCRSWRVQKKATLGGKHRVHSMQTPYLEGTTERSDNTSNSFWTGKGKSNSHHLKSIYLDHVFNAKQFEEFNL